MNKNKRKQVVVDEELQYGLSRRLVTYWAFTWFLVFALPITVRMFSATLPFNELAREVMSDFWFPMLVSIFLLPIVIWDSLRFSNRFAGPAFRISRTIREMADDQPVRTISLRHKDFCGELAGSVNYLIDKRSGEPDMTEPARESLEPVAS